MTKPRRSFTLPLAAIVGGGQALGTLDDGRKVFVWGGLPDEEVTAQETKRKSNFSEAIVTDVLSASADRIEPVDPESYLSTSPWQIMNFEAEQRYKAALILEAFTLHDVQLPNVIDVYTDEQTTHYRNKVEFSWYSDSNESGEETLRLAFFRRGSKGKIPIDQFSLIPDSMYALADSIRLALEQKGVTARQLKTLLIRCDQTGRCAWQLYVKDRDFRAFSEADAAGFDAQGGEVIYSDPRSPASRITERLLAVGNVVLTDTILNVPFSYATEGFFQVNLPVYEQALEDMRTWVPSGKTVDLYSGVGSIGLTIGGDECTLVEVDEHAVREMKRNITSLGSRAQAVLAPAEKSLEYIDPDATIIVDPPRAGLHADVVARLREVMPARIIYLSCNPVTQARDVGLLQDIYRIVHHKGYNFFPRTPHIEHLVVLEKH
ncbi:MAG TPA: RsmD family RNA methyltransferase [Patescibacteria group bacterium]|jgi:23S rRNA (uracil1939-C5)-methyltransferase|nr:RsmD family RNA methyltransferase [Patescibacteria group bacterium]